LDEEEDLFTDPDPERELPLERLTFEELLRLEPEDLETEPEDLFPEFERFTLPDLLLPLLLDEPLDLTLTLRSELPLEVLLDTPEDLVDLTLVELLVLFTLLRPLLVSEEEDLRLFKEERFVLRSYF